MKYVNKSDIFQVGKIRSAQTHFKKQLSFSDELDCSWWGTGPLESVQNPAAPMVDLDAITTAPNAPGDIPDDETLHLFESILLEKNFSSS